VACFCVLLGYFASKPTEKTACGYALERYLFFALQILIVESIFYLLFYLMPDQTYLADQIPLFWQEVWQILEQIPRDAFGFDYQMVGTYWCVKEFVLGSILILVMQKQMNGKSLLLRLTLCLAVIAALIQMNQVWLAICVMGWLLRLMEEIRIPSKTVSAALMIGMIAAVPWLIRREECDMTYLLNGVASLFVLYVIGRLPKLQRVIGLKPLAYLGRYCFEMFLLHTPVFYLIESVLVDLDWMRPPFAGYAVQFAAAYGLTALLAMGWQWAAKNTILRPGKWLAGKCTLV